MRSTNPKVRCTNGDPWTLMLEQVNSQIIDWAQWGINELIKEANKFLDHIPFVGPNLIPYICWNTPVEPTRCQDGMPTAEELQHFRECEDPDFKGGLDMACYYHRVCAHCADYARDDN